MGDKIPAPSRLLKHGNNNPADQGFVKLFEEYLNLDLSDHVLILPAVSVGNVGQLTIDLLLANIPAEQPPVKIGRIFHRSLEAVVASDCIRNDDAVKSDGLMTSCEVFHVKEAKYVILHFHAPVMMRGRTEFVEELVSWIQEMNFSLIVCFTSVFASDRVDRQLVGIPFRFLSTPTTPTSMLKHLQRMEWKHMEKREFPAPAVIEGNENSGDSGIIHLPGSGITKTLYESCLSRQIPFLGLTMFASEGDNTPEAMTLFQMADKLFNFRNLPTTEASDESPTRDKLVVPVSWTSFREESHPSLY